MVMKNETQRNYPRSRPRTVQQVEAAKGPIAVFAANGGWNATKVSSQNFARQIQRTPELFVGLYDLNSRLEWIADDLFEAGIR